MPPTRIPQIAGPIARSYARVCDAIDDKVRDAEDALCNAAFGHPPPLHSEEFCRYVVIPAVIADLALAGYGGYSLVTLLWK